MRASMFTTAFKLLPIEITLSAVDCWKLVYDGKFICMVAEKGERFAIH